MKKENVVVILCDSLSYEEDILKNMPNLSRYRDNILNFSNYFSQAPYTEAATVPIFSSSNVTDYSGYFNNLKYKPLNINEIFKSLGYKTYNTLWFYPNTLSFLRGVDEYDYVDTFSITYYLLEYRLVYLRDIYRKKEFTQDHQEMLISLLDDFFKMISRYIDDYNNNNYRFKLLNKYTVFDRYNFKVFEVTANENSKSYFENKEKYVYKLMTKDNKFFNNNFFEIKKSYKFNKVIEELNKSIKKLMIKQLSYGMIHGIENRCIFTLGHTIKNLNNKDEALNSFKNWAKYTINYPGKHMFKMMSGKVMLERVAEYLQENKDQNNFVLCHIMDNHYPFNFISVEYDQVEDEIKDIINEKGALDKKMNNFYIYSKAYIDKQIGEFINKLEKDGQIYNTTIIITSDHGSSYLNKIHRTEICSTFYDENYRIPLMIFNKNVKGRNIDNLGLSTQFIPTIIDFLKLPYKEEWVKENSILEKDSEYVILEYFGAGCPDYLKRDRLLCIRNRKYKVQYKVNVDAENGYGEIMAVFDIIKDPKELIDIKNEVKEDEEIKYLIQLLNSRIKNIKR